jgi:hypothetical protein
MLLSYRYELNFVGGASVILFEGDTFRDGGGYRAGC